ncbi:alanine--tRNA ligase [Candidatus Sumerlaeota bacterium]|nr:alanine--tRNA ligase [Candidatus Sumerlaeota bacterium]
MITAAEIRQRYCDFFVERGHKLVVSAPLVPPDDPSLLFTTAGMVQFKSYFTGTIDPPFRTAVSVQKCLRAGGKGSDLENVGRTLRHHTFFEMLGNFSFGGYFKQDAIVWAWEFCTGKDWLALPAERIWATVFGKRDESGEWTVDDEAERIWKQETGVVNPILRLDEEENFWGPAGGTGACGPCSEIKFFMGTDEELERYRKMARSGGKDLDRVLRDNVEEGDLFLEIWNLVFPQYDQQPDGTRSPLKNRGIDTGAGLERITTACQMIASEGKVWSPYETDLLAPLVAAVAEIASLPYPRLRGGEEAEARLRKMGQDPEAVRLAVNACADHARALTFAMAEGVIPSNEGRGYVIRRILRRAARFGMKLGIGDPFLWKLVAPVVDLMGPHYPELTKHPKQIEEWMRQEEEQFSRTLRVGSDMLDRLLAGREKGGQLTGEEAFRLYDTYGFPFELTAEICQERGVEVDEEAFENSSAKARGRMSPKDAVDLELVPLARDMRKKGQVTEFVGYEEMKARAAIVGLADHAGNPVHVLEPKARGIVTLDRTPFYGEAGGQIGDQGKFSTPEGQALFSVQDTQKTDDGLIFHYGKAQAQIKLGQKVESEVDRDLRGATIKNHSATHLLQGALKRLIGGHVTQAGSYVGPDHLRFDFTHQGPLAESDLREIERVVAEQIQRNLAVETTVMDLEEARATGAIAPFGEKYGAVVRVVKMGDFSTEFCGGTHVAATGEIGSFIIVSESSVASGIRRIEAQTGMGAAETIARQRSVLAEISRTLAVAPDRLAGRIATLQDELKQLRRGAQEARSRELAGKSAEFPTIRLGEASGCVAWLQETDVAGLRSTLDLLKSKHGNRKFFAVLGSSADGKATLIIGATPDLAGTPLEAGKLIRRVAPLFGGKGGGKAQFAQAGGKDPGKLQAIIEDGTLLKALQQD